MKFYATPPFEEYFISAEENIKNILSSGGEQIILLEEIHQFLVGSLMQSEPEWSSAQAMLSVNSMMVWLSAIRTASTGHMASTLPLLRASLESACYAYLIWKDPLLEDTWLERHDDNEKLKECRKAFTGAVFECSKHIGSRDIIDESFPSMMNYAYQQAIDHGGHPNPKSILTDLSVRDHSDDRFVSVNLASIFATESAPVMRMLFACLEFGKLIAIILTISTKQMDKRVLAKLHEVLAKVDDYMMAIVAEN